MSSRRTRTALYVYDIPVNVLQQLCMTLDIDKGWQALAAVCGYTMDQVKTFELEYYRPHRSPTERLVLDWGVKNPTIRDLYNKLKKIERIREMRLLEPLLIAIKEEERRLAIDREREKAANRTVADQSEDRTPQADLGSGKEKEGPKSVEPCELRTDPTEGSDRSAPSACGKTPSPEYARLKNIHSEDDKSEYAKLNLNNATQNAARKTSGEKELGIQLNTTKEFPSNYLKVIPAEKNHSGADKSPTGKNSDGKQEKVPAESIDREPEFQLSEKELGDARSLTTSESGEIAKETAVAVSATASFTYKELSRATNGFSDGSKIGEGAFGDVYIGNLKHSKCAVKRLRQKELFKADKDQIAHHATELKTLLRYRHENIVQLYGYAVDGDEVCLVYQHMENGSLEDRLQCKNDSPPLKWLQRINILRGAACGLQYLHTMDGKYPLIHGDVKSANVLLDKHNEAKLSDFGLSEHANAGPQTGKYTHVTKKEVNGKVYGTRAYLPPEFATNGASTKSDTYGFGVIIFETCTGEKAYDERREADKFLVPYVSSIMEEQDEAEWPKHLRDSKAGVCPDEIFHLLKLAQTCISERKKDRPVMPDVLKQLEWIQDHWKQIQADTGTCMGPPGDDYLTAQPPPNMGSFHAGIHSLNLDPSLPTDQLEGTPQINASPQSGKEMPESLRLQKMYDENRYKEELRRIARETFDKPHSQSEHAGQEEIYPSDARKLAEMDSYLPNSLSNYSSGSSSSTLTSTQTLTSSDASDNFAGYPSDASKLENIENFDKENLQGTANIPVGETSGEMGLPNNLPVDATLESESMTPLEAMRASHDEYVEFSEKLAANGTDLKKLEKQRQFDQENACLDDSVRNNLTEGEKMRGDTGATETTDCPPEGNAGESASTNKMASFFAMYKEESASLNEDISRPDEGTEGEGQMATGEGGLVYCGDREMVYCGDREIEGQQMALLLNPATGQYYAVDPATIDPSLYHRQQLSYYTQYQTDLA